MTANRRISQKECQQVNLKIYTGNYIQTKKEITRGCCFVVSIYAYRITKTYYFDIKMLISCKAFCRSMHFSFICVCKLIIKYEDLLRKRTVLLIPKGLFASKPQSKMKLKYNITSDFSSPPMTACKVSNCSPMISYNQVLQVTITSWAQTGTGQQ